MPWFREGVEALGYQVTDTPKKAPGPEDILVMWNRLPTTDPDARIYEEAGRKVIVVEHGWVGDETYAVALNHHNGAGDWYIGENTRWPAFGISLKQWRAEGDAILVIPQRGIGVPPAAMPRDWPEWTMEHLRQITNRPIKLRKPQERVEPIEPAFANVHAVVTWASGAGIKAIVHGVPVFYEMPDWIGGCAAKRFGGQTTGEDLENPYLGTREPMLHRLSWAMWSKEEIAAGKAFQCVLSL